ncbi:MAG TPA: nucleotide exchange factor GrpE [Firmicutes bacterium]|nr:nucleotide exchange factor GrpE [Bacillota bacterium]
MIEERAKEDVFKEKKSENTVDDVQQSAGEVNGKDAGVNAGSEDNKQIELATKLKEAEETAAGYLAQLTRLQADFVNFRRRMERERAEQIRYANEQLFHKLLPVVDNLERAIEAGKKAKSTEPLLEGINQVLKQFLAVLEKEGVTPLDPGIGQPFDPNYQEALMREEGEAEVVVQELLRGWCYHERVLRPTLVKVGPHATDHQATPETETKDETPDTVAIDNKKKTTGTKEVEK